MSGRVLIVDQDLANRGFLRECLEKEGHHVTTIIDGSEVAPFLASEIPNVLILNINTPGVREKDLLLQIRKNGRSRVLLVISERGDPFLRDAVELGVYGFIHKPFNPGEICTLVHHLMH